MEGADAIPTKLMVSKWPGSELGDGVPLAMRPASYWQGIPARLRDPDRYRVERVVRLAFAATDDGADIELRVRDRDGHLVWANERPTPAIGGPT